MRDAIHHAFGSTLHRSFDEPGAGYTVGEDERDHRHTRLLCVDDHELLVEGLKAVFAHEDRIRIVGQLRSAERLLDDVARLEPDVILLDIELPGPDIFEAADRLHHLFPLVPFLFLSAYIRDGYLAAAYKCGASGYFGKGDDLDEIISGIDAIARRATSMLLLGSKVRARLCIGDPSPIAFAHSRVKHSLTLAPLQTLTNRELEVLRLIGKGLSRVAIADELSRSAKTIDGHQERMMRKLGFSARSDLMRFAIREGLAEA